MPRQRASSAPLRPGSYHECNANLGPSLADVGDVSANFGRHLRPPRRLVLGVHARALRPRGVDEEFNWRWNLRETQYDQNANIAMLHECRVCGGARRAQISIKDMAPKGVVAYGGTRISYKTSLGANSHRAGEIRASPCNRIHQIWALPATSWRTRQHLGDSSCIRVISEVSEGLGNLDECSSNQRDAGQRTWGSRPPLATTTKSEPRVPPQASAKSDASFRRLRARSTKSRRPRPMCAASGAQV